MHVTFSFGTHADVAVAASCHLWFCMLLSVDPSRVVVLLASFATQSRLAEVLLVSLSSSNALDAAQERSKRAQGYVAVVNANR